MRNSYAILTTDAFILHTRGIGEADRMITVLTRENGVLDVYARSIRKETAKMRGAVKPYGQVRLSLIQGKKNILKDITVTDTLDAVWNEQRKYKAYVILLRHIHTLVPAVSEEDESYSLSPKLLFNCSNNQMTISPITYSLSRKC